PGDAPNGCAPPSPFRGAPARLTVGVLLPRLPAAHGADPHDRLAAHPRPAAVAGRAGPGRAPGRDAPRRPPGPGAVLALARLRVRRVLPPVAARRCLP